MRVASNGIGDTCDGDWQVWLVVGIGHNGNND